jgi:hypothetical protein
LPIRVDIGCIGAYNTNWDKYSGGDDMNIQRKFGNNLTLFVLLFLLVAGCAKEKPVEIDQDSISPAAINDLSVESTTSSSVTLSWTSPGDDGDVGIASKYDIRYSTSQIDDDNWEAAIKCDGEPSPQPAGSEESFVVSGLEENTDYYFAIRTADKTPNWSGISNLITGKTKPSHYITWERTYGGQGYEFADAVAVAPDGGYVCAGNSTSFDGGFGDVYLIKVDEYGNLLWERNYGGPLQEMIRSIAVMPDGGYIMAGEAGLDDIFDDTTDAYFVRVDGSGNLLWEKKFSGIGVSRAMSAIGGPDGGCIAVGYTASRIRDENDYYYGLIMKVDDFGEIEWLTPLDDTLDVEGLSPYSVTATPDGGYLVLDMYFRIVKLDGDGNILWQNEIDVEGLERIRSVVAAPDGGYVAAGWSYPDGSDSTDVLVVKFDESGNKEWTNTFGGNRRDVAYYVTQASDGGYIIAGAAYSFRAGRWADVYLLKVDESGELVWQRSYGQDENANGSESVAVAPDGGYIVEARVFIGGFGPSDFWLIKTDPNGEL